MQAGIAISPQHTYDATLRGHGHYTTHITITTKIKQEEFTFGAYYAYASLVLGGLRSHRTAYLPPPLPSA